MVMGRGLVVTGALEPAARVLERVFKMNLQLGLLVSLFIAFTLSMFVKQHTGLGADDSDIRGPGSARRHACFENAHSVKRSIAAWWTRYYYWHVDQYSCGIDRGRSGMPEMDVFHFTPIVLLASLVALPYLWLVMPRLLPDNSVTEASEMRRFHTRLRITNDSTLIGEESPQSFRDCPKTFASTKLRRGQSNRSSACISPERTKRSKTQFVSSRVS